MNKRSASLLSRPLNWGSFKIAGIYLIIGILWILFSDQLAERITLSKEMLASVSLYKGWAFVIVTAFLLYWLIQRYTSRLHASEKQLQMVINTLPVLISYIDKNQHYQFANESYEEWFGEKAKGKHIEQVVGQPIYQKTSKYVDKVLRGENVTYETEIPFRDGSERFVSATYVPDIAENGQVKGFFTLVQDISEQREAREKLRQWADAFEGCAHGIAIGDPDTNRIVVCNPAFANMHKCRVEDIVGASILSLYAPSDHEHVRRNIERADQIGHVRFEAHMTRKGRDKSVFPVQMDLVSVLGEDGELIHRVVTAQDISERRFFDEKLKESETKYRTLAEHLPVITYISKPDQYVGVSYISPQIESFGFDSKEWLADPEFWFKQIHPEDREQVEAELQKFQAGAESFKAEYRLLLPNGETRWFHDESIRVKDQDGKTLLKQGFMLDISERRRAEEVLLESEERYRIVSELTSDYAYKDRVEADGTIVPEWITESFTRITGYTLEETRAPGFWQQLVHPEDVQILLAHIQAILSRHTHTMELRVITKSGQVRWLRDYSNPVGDADQERVTGLYGAVQDVTDFKQAEEKLLLQAHWLEQINDAVITSNPDLVITAWNPAAERIYGWKAEEVIGKKGEEIFKSEFFSKTSSEVLQELKESGKFSAEITQLRKDGSRIHIETHTVLLRDETGHGVGNLSVNRDITERKQTQEKLIRSEEKYRYLFQNNPHPMWVYDRKTLAFLDVNEAAIAKYGYSRQEFLNMTIVNIRPPEDVERLMKNLAQPRQPLEHSEGWKHLLKDGTIIYVEITSHTIEIDGHESALVVAVDVTERKKAEEYLHRFELLSEHSRDIILFVDRKDGRILEANAAAVQTYGYSREELLALTIPDLRASGTQGLTAEQMAQADAGGTLFETIHQRRDGTTFPVEVSSQGATIGGERILLSIIRNITERKRVDEQLERSNQRLNEILVSIQDDFYVLDRDWNFAYASRLFTSKIGKEPEDFVGNNFWEMFPKHAGTVLEENFRAAMEKREIRRFEIGGKYTAALYRMTVFPSAEGVTVIGTDITESKQTEEALHIKDELLRLTSEIAKVGGWEFDPATGKGTWTDEVARIHDLDPAQETNIEIGLSFYVGSSREKVEKAVQEAIEFGKPYDLELEMITLKGNRKWVRTMALPITNDGRVVKVKGIFQDITERKQIEDALQKAHSELEHKVEERTAALSQANALLQALMDTMPDQIYFKDIQGRFIRNSRSQASLLGLNDPAQAIGKTDFDFFPHAARAHAEEQEVMRAGQPLIDFEEWVVWPDGRESWVSTTKVPLRNSEGETIGIFGISRDITERKRAEQSIQQLNSDLEKQTVQLQVSNKELEAFSYSVSHDLRAPLRAIDGYTRILVEDYEANLDAEGKRVCSVISAEARRMGQLIDDLLSFSRLGRKEMYSSNVDMKDLVVSVFDELLKDEDRARIDFQIAGLPSTSADSSLMRQVWVNLLSNAIKFTSKKERATIEVGSESSQEEVVYYVHDTGAGFDMEYANKLFGVFQRLHGESEFEGTGVGLAIVQRIIRRHGGRVWAEGEMDKGATFYFALPRKENHHE